MLLEITLFILLFAGIADSAYLVYEHYRNKGNFLVCPIGHNCSSVTESKWNTFLGIRNDVFGVFFFTGLLILNVGVQFYPQFTEMVYGLFLIAEAGASLFAIYLIAIQAFVLKEWCFWCLVLSGVTFLLFANTIVLALPYYG